MPQTHRKLRLEQLEDRCLLTAVVTQIGDTVEITTLEDAEQDEVVIVRQRDNDRFKIVGDVAGEPVIVDGVNRLEVALGDGTDQLVINGRQIKEGLVGGLSIDMGADADGIRIKGLGVAGLVEILRDDVNGLVSTSPEVITIEDSRFVGGTNIATGDGVDQIRIFGDSRLRATLNIDTGASDFGRDGNDFVVLADSEFGFVNVNMLGGNDLLELFNNNFNGFASFDGGDGDDDEANVVGNGNFFNGGVDFDNFETIF